MPRLDHHPPSWVREYIGIPFAENGRERSTGLDCYGLVRAVYAERYGVALPSFSGQPLGVIAEQLNPDEHCTGSQWQVVEPDGLDVGDVGVFRITGDRLHVGVVVTREKMLHSLKGTDSCMEPFLSPLWWPRLLNFHRHAGGIHLVAKLHPFSNTRVDMTLPFGSTITEMLAAAGVQVVPGLRAFVGGVEVPFEAWDRVRPKPGRLLNIACIPEGGGGNKDIFRIVLSIAVIAASIAIPGAIGLTAAAGLGTQGALLGAGIAIGGTLLINALIPPPKPRLSDNGAGSGSPTIQGTRNEARPYQPIPMVLGRYRMAPPYGAVPYSEVIEGQQYIRCLFVLGYGPVQVSDLRIGDTPLSNYEGVEYQIHYGFPNNRNLSLYPNTIREDAMSVALTAAGSWATRTTHDGIEEISLDVTFPQGLATFDRSGNPTNRTVTVEAQYRKVGTVTWKTVNGDAGVIGSPTTERGLDLLERTPECTQIYSGVHIARVAWSGTGGLFPDAKPGYLPANKYTWEASGFVHADVAGTYSFGVDGSDACDIEIDGQIVASWYDTHAPAGSAGVPNFTGHNGTIDLDEGWHQIRIRVENRSSGGGAIAAGWIKPGGSWQVIPQSAFSQTARIASPGILSVRAFSWAQYASSLSTTAAKAESLRRSLAWAVPTGQYEVRLRRTTADTTDIRIVDKVFWTALRSIDHRDPVQMRGVARIALRIKATDQLNGVVDQFNCLVQTVGPTWDRTLGRWVRGATSNPAALYKLILQGRANHRPIPDAKVDYSALQAWHEACDDAGWTFNGIVDFPGTVYERLTDVASAGRATFGMRDGKYSVVRDKVQMVPIQHFTPRNSFGFRGSKVFHIVPHALRVRFMNSATGYQQDERVVYDDGYNEDGSGGLIAATIFEELQLFGCTDSNLAWKQGRYYLAVAKLRPEVFSLSTDFEHLPCSRGDMVLLTHDVPLLGLSAGRILRLNLDGPGNLVSIETDEICPMDSSSSYRLRVRFDDGTCWVRDVITIEGENRTVFFTVPVPVGQPMPQEGDLFLFGPAGSETRECIVKSIDIDKDMSAKLTLVDHAPGVHSADTGAIPPYDSGITQPPVFEDGPAIPIVETIRSDDFVMVPDASGVLQPRIVIGVRHQPGTRPVAAYCQVRLRLKEPNPTPTIGPWSQVVTVPIDNDQIVIGNVRLLATYQIALRNLTAEGKASSWQYNWDPDMDGSSVPIEHTVGGQQLLPPEPIAFAVSRLSDGTRRFIWDLGTVPRNVAGVHIRYGAVGATWSSLLPLHDGVLEASPAEFNRPQAGVWTFGIKAVDTAGRESDQALYVTATLGPAALDNVVLQEDCRAAGFPGSRSNCFLTAAGQLEASGLDFWFLLPLDGINTWADWHQWNRLPNFPIAYTHPMVDLGFVAEFSPDVNYVVQGAVTTLVEFRFSADGTTFSPWANLEDIRTTAVRARFVQMRITIGRTDQSQVLVINEMVILLRAERVVHIINDFDTASVSDVLRRFGVGDVRLPLPDGIFGSIRSVLLSFNGVGGGRTWELVDRDPSQGPRIRVYNSAHAQAEAVVDATIIGYRATPLPPSGGLVIAPSSFDFSDPADMHWIGVC